MDNINQNYYSGGPAYIDYEHIFNTKPMLSISKISFVPINSFQ